MIVANVFLKIFARRIRSRSGRRHVHVDVERFHSSLAFHLSHNISLFSTTIKHNGIIINKLRERPRHVLSHDSVQTQIRDVCVHLALANDPTRKVVEKQQNNYNITLIKLLCHHYHHCHRHHCYYAYHHLYKSFTSIPTII